MENVLTEVKGKATLVAMDNTGSITLQRLLPLSSADQVGGVLAELGGESGSELKAVSCDRCGGHVVESAIRQMSRVMGKFTIDCYTIQYSIVRINPKPLLRPQFRVCFCVHPFKRRSHLPPQKKKKRRVKECWRAGCCV